MSAEILIPAHSLVVLIGASGSGKTTFATKWFAVSEILSSDAFRAKVGRGEDDLGATGRAFRALYAGLTEQLAGSGMAVVDATNIHASDRRALVRRAIGAGAPAIGVVLDATLHECLVGDAARAGRHVPPAAIERQWERLRLVLDRADPFAGDGFAAVHRLVGHTGVRSAVVRREAPL